MTSTQEPSPDSLPDEDFEALLVFLRESRGVDFTGYKRTSLRRLVGRRMGAAGVQDVREYLDQLEVNPVEVRELFDSLLINVTGFFRDAAVWEALRQELVPALLERLGPDEPVRAWSAACATGQEAYTLAMLLHRVMGEEAFRSRVKIYATDVDESALAVARAGRYKAAALARQASARQVTEAAFLHAPDAQVVLDADQRLALVNETAVRELGVARSDIGRSFHEHEISYRPTDLRPVVGQVLATGERATVQDVRWSRPDLPDRWWDVQVAPLRGTDEPLGVTIVFVEVTRYHELTGELSRAHAGLQEAYEELQSSSEELETTNEELQSAIEELETTNEELQSTNEELETMNEELQSANEEMQTVNDELRERTSEVGEMNAFLESVLSGLRTAVAVVDRDLRVLVWSAKCEEMWGLRSYEVEGRALTALDGGIPSDRLTVCARTVLATGAASSPDGVVAVNRLGQRMFVTTTGSPLRDRAGAVRGAILTMEEHSLEDAPESAL
jgi:two-component system CheB/CheR fusion protein